MNAAFPPSIEFARLYEKTSQRGTKYFVGRLGLVRITLLPGEVAEDGTPTWRMLLQDAPRSQAATEPRARHSPWRPSRARQRPANGDDTGTPIANDSVSALWPEDAS